MAEWLEAARADPGRSGVFVDFDGTLSPIVDDPAAASPHPVVPSLLARLAGRWGRVVVVSGRPVSYLAGHLSGAGATLLCGLYGLERAAAASPEIYTVAEAESWRQPVADAARTAEAQAPPGVVVERKGLTVTLHYRSAPGEAKWVQRFVTGVERSSGLVAHGGKMSVELRPPVEVDKGTVVRDLAAGLVAVLFAGDDLGDLPAFAELDRLRRVGVATLGVAAGGGETPPEVEAAADVVVEGPAGVVALLTELASGPDA